MIRRNNIALLTPLLLLLLSDIALGIRANPDYETTISVIDMQGNPIQGAHVSVTLSGAAQGNTYYTGANGKVVLSLPEGWYMIQAYPGASLYGVPYQTIENHAFVLIPPVTSIELQLPIYDVTLRFVMPNRLPVVGASVVIGGVSVGVTDAGGAVSVRSIPATEFEISATLFGYSIHATDRLTVSHSGAYQVYISDMAQLRVTVSEDGEHGVEGAAVVIKAGSTTIFSGDTDSQGTVQLYAPFGSYDIEVLWKGTEWSKSVSLAADTDVKITVGQSLWSLLMWGVPFAALVAIVAIVLLRRRKLPPPPPS